MKINRNASLRIAAFGILLCAPTPWVAAETAMLEEGVDQHAVQTSGTGYRLGDFLFVPQFTLAGQRNDNIYATDTNKVTDFLTVASPSLDIRSTWRRHSLRAHLDADLARYHENVAENYNDYRIDIRGRYDLSLLSNLFGGIGLSNEHEGRESADADSSGISPTTYTSQKLHFGAEHKWGPNSLRVGATLESLHYDNIPASFGTLVNNVRDRLLTGLGLRFNRRLDNRNIIYAQGIIDRRDYVERDLNGYLRDSSGYRAGAGLEHVLGPFSKLKAYLGLLTQRYEDPRFTTLKKPDVAASLTFLAAPRTLLSINLERALTETTQAGSAGSLDTTLGARLERYFSDRLSAHALIATTHSDYLDIARRDKLHSAGVGLKIFLSKDVYLAADVTRQQRDSNDLTASGPLSGDSYDFVGNQFLLTLGLLPYPKSPMGISSTVLAGTIELGAGYVSNDSLRFGRYSGLNTQGAHLLANLDVRATDASAGYSRLTVQDAALDTRSVRFLWGRQDRYKAHLDYAETPALWYPGQTIFSGVGTDTLSLPTDWFATATPDGTEQMDRLEDSLTDLQIGTQRKRLGVGAAFLSTRGWKLSINFRNETKEGLETISGVLGHSPGNVRAALLPQPIDYLDQKMDIVLGYTQGKGRFDLRYHASLFTNGNDSLTWQSPFSSTGSRYTDGSLALPPDNQLHRLALSGAYLLPGNSRLTGNLSLGLLLQNEAFLPYTINPALDRPLPHSSLDGKVLLKNATLGFASHPLKKLFLNAGYKLDERDNRTPVDTYEYVWADSQDTDPPRDAIARNAPYSYKRQSWTLDAKYRLHRRASLSLGYANERIERTPAEVRETKEDRYDLRLSLRPTPTVQLAVGVGSSHRGGSDYIADGSDNPLLRKYNMADRERRNAGIDITWQPVTRISVSATAKLANDGYENSAIGLTDARQSSFTLNTALQLSETTQLYCFYNRDNIRSKQAGSLDGLDTAPAPDWQADWFASNDDRIDSIGLGAKVTKLTARMDIGADYVYSRSRGDITVVDTTDPAVTLLEHGLPYPQLASTVHSVKLYVDYRIEKRLKLRTSLVHEKYATKDWALDGVGVSGIGNVLLLGEQAPNDSVNYLGVTLQYRF